MSSVRGAAASLPITQPEGRISTGQEYRFMSREEASQTQQQEGQVEQRDKDVARDGENQKSKAGILKDSIGIMGNAMLHPINTTTFITKKIVQPLTDFVSGIEEMGLPTFRRSEEEETVTSEDEEHPTAPSKPTEPVLKGIEEEQRTLMQEEHERERLRRARGQEPWSEVESAEPKHRESPKAAAGIRREAYFIDSDQTEHSEICDDQSRQQPQKQVSDETFSKEQLYLDVERRIVAQHKIIEQLGRNTKELMTERELHSNMLVDAERHRQNAEQSTQIFRIEVNDKLQQRDKSRHEELNYEKLRVAAYTKAVELENERVRALAQLKLTEKKLDHFRDLCSHHDTGMKQTETLLEKNKMEEEGAQHQLKRLLFEKESIQFVSAAPPVPLIAKPLELSVTVKPQILLDCRLKPNVQQTDVHATALITEEISAAENRMVGESLESRTSQSAVTAETTKQTKTQSFRETEKQKQTEIGEKSRHTALKDTAAQSSTNTPQEWLPPEKGYVGVGLIRKQIAISEDAT